MSWEAEQETFSGYPIEFHCHGAGEFDFSRFDPEELISINRLFEREQVDCVITGFLPYSDRYQFQSYMEEFHFLRRSGQLPRILGVALEGPLLTSIGGTPELGNWRPTFSEWEQIFRCGEYGLKYVVLSPDAHVGGAYQADEDHPDVDWIVHGLLTHNISVALGHFQRIDPEASAASIDRVVEIAQSLGCRPFDGSVITDHLFNDMPRTVKHTWRGPSDQQHRDMELRQLDIASWTINNIVERVGPVPGVIIRHAEAGSITICLNFDGEHVDAAIAKRVVELVSDAPIIAMTDRANIEHLCRQKLFFKEGESLLYQSADIVAAGTQSIDLQIANMVQSGIAKDSIWRMVKENPLKVLREQVDRKSERMKCLLSEIGRIQAEGAIESELVQV